MSWQLNLLYIAAEIVASGSWARRTEHRGRSIHVVCEDPAHRPTPAKRRAVDLCRCVIISWNREAHFPDAP